MSISKILGRVRGSFPGNYPEGREEEQFQLNCRGDMLVSQALPERAELVRLGNSYWTASATTAPVTAIPTTAAHLALWNGEQDDGLSYVIDFVGTYSTVSAAAAINLGLCAQVNLGKVASPVGVQAIKSLSGRANYRGKGNAKTAAITITDNTAWHPVGNQLVIANTANILASVEYAVYGRYVIPPGGMFALAALANAAGNMTCISWVIWHEVRLILG